MVEVQTFGLFKVKYKDVELTAASFNSEMLVKLFVYIVMHREVPIESEVIGRELWPENSVTNPAGALKNLAYRLRNFLKEYFPEDNFIISSRGFYGWNPEIECSVDAEVFDGLVKQVKYTETRYDKIGLLMQAVDVYKGEFMPEVIDFHWFNVLKAYYHGSYLTAAKGLATFLYDGHRYQEVSNLCSKVLEIDRLEEQIYYYLIMACVKSNSLQMGLEVYERASKLLKKELGVKNLTKLDEAYDALLGMDNGVAKLDIRELKDQLLEEREPGPFFCGYTIFKEIFQLIARQRSNEKYVGMLVLFTVDFAFDPTTGKVEKFRSEKIMKAFNDVIRSTLRMGDVVSKYSEYQYCVLLNGCSLENVGVVIDRINNMFTHRYPQYSDASIKCQVETVNLEEI